MQMLSEERLHLLFIPGEQVRGDLDLVAVLVVALGSDAVDVLQVARRCVGGELVVRDAEAGEVGRVDVAAGVMGEALVAGHVVVPVCAHGGGGSGGEGSLWCSGGLFEGLRWQAKRLACEHCC